MPEALRRFPTLQLSFPIPLRFLLAKDSRLFSEVLSLFARTLFAFFRKQGRALGIQRPLPGAVAFLQRFGSALQLTPHIHLLALEGVFEHHARREGRGDAKHGPGAAAPVRFCPLPPPDDEEVEALLRKVALRTVNLLRKRGLLDEAAGCEDALDFLRADAVRAPTLPLHLQESPRRRRRRCAFLEGFSLHADTWVHAHNRDGLQRLANYGARGPLSLERLSQLPDGNLAYRMKRPSASGAQVLVLTPTAFLRKLAALVPPPRVNLVRFFGVLAPNSKVRPYVVPSAPALQTDCAPEPQPSQCAPRTPTANEEAAPARRRRIPWAELLRRTFAADVLSCTRCGGQRRIVACVVATATAREILQHLKLPSAPLPLAKARAPPQLELYDG